MRLSAACFGFARLVSQAFSPNNRYWRWLVGWLSQRAERNADFAVLQDLSRQQRNELVAPSFAAETAKQLVAMRQVDSPGRIGPRWS